MRYHTQRQSGAARRWASVALVAFALMVAGCRVPGQPAPVNASGLTLRVLRTSAFPQNHIPPFERTVTDPTKVQALYTALYALPPFPKGTYSCPMDIGLAYQLTFMRGQTVVSSATVKPDGCEGVTLPHGDIRWAVNQDHFWTTFAATLGIPRSDVYPSRTTSGPIAPTPSAGQ
jgi:hypothetical protein